MPDCRNMGALCGIIFSTNVGKKNNVAWPLCVNVNFYLLARLAIKTYILVYIPCR